MTEMNATEATEKKSLNFIEQAVENDLREGKNGGKVQTGLALFTASTYPSSMTFLLKSPKASANKNTTISKIVMLVTKPLQVNIPSTIFSQTRFIQF